VTEQAQASASTSGGDALLAEGSHLGRFRIVRHLGRGGMGAVYEAEDIVQERRVAMKVVALLGSRGRERMLAEARALERIKHPNVVQLYDVGVDQDQVYLALELVRGCTLSQWLKKEPRGWSEIIVHFVASGRGLAEAHKAGLAHGDFKPSNVLVASDGRVLVSDFGLAQSMEMVTGEHSMTTGRITASQNASTHGGSDQSTLPGQRIVGTPAYMAPELFRGAQKVSATDQFAFCVALYEALYDAHPFGGGSWHEVARGIGAGELKVPRRRTEIPRHIRQAVLRGLAHVPSERWPSMQALLRQLTRPPEHRISRNAVLASGAGLGLVVLAGLATTLGHDEPDRCEAAAHGLSAAWDDAEHVRVAGAFNGAEGRLVTRALDLWSEDWTQAHGEVCDAKKAPAQSQRDAGLGCLEHTVVALQQTTTALAQASAETAHAALQDIAALPDPMACVE